MITRSVLALLAVVPWSISAQIVAASEQSTMGKVSAHTVTVNLENVSLEHALREIATRAGMRIIYSTEVSRHPAMVTLNENNVTPKQAIDVVLKGTGLVAGITADGTTFVIKKASIVRQKAAPGIVIGKVTDAKTGKSISGASVAIGNDSRSAVSGADGSYRLMGVPAGVNIVTVRLVGYAKQSKSVTVDNETAITLDFKLEPSANVLDQVVVTGTVAQTELKAVPNAITVITAKQIEERGITHIDQLFRGDIPGLFAQNIGSGALLDEVQMFSRGTTALSSGSGDTKITNPIKTYVDGVELADSKYLSQIDPKNIERIEILTGPQASTIYGSNAINGVMQIFTKRGTSSRPQLAVSLQSGWVENSFRTSMTPQHNYSAQVTGIEGHISYSAGGSWNYMGPWTPSKQTTRTGAFGGFRSEFGTRAGKFTADMTLSKTLAANRQRAENTQVYAGYRETGLYRVTAASGSKPLTVSNLNEQLIGFTLGYGPVSWWSNDLSFGQDAVNSQSLVTTRPYGAPFDTTLSLSSGNTDRRSLRYVTTARVPISSLLRATITGGVDGWQLLESTTSAQPSALTGTLTGSPTVFRRPSHNTGAFANTQIDIADGLFLTYGLRLEWNPYYGAEAQPNYAPRYGAAFTRSMGATTVKLRGSYGSSTRPPLPNLKVAQTISQYWGSSLWFIFSPAITPFYPAEFDGLLANPDLGPEYQKGGEGGIEMYFGARSSLVITRYNQTVNDLIISAAADSVRSLTTCPQFTCEASSRDASDFGYYRQLKNVNIGAIRNQGWEMQGTTQLGALSARGTYTWSKSRVLGITPRYRSLFPASSYPTYQPGATPEYIPEHTWAAGLTYSNSASSVALNLNGIGQLRSTFNDFSARNLSQFTRLSINLARIGSTAYPNMQSAYATADLNASHRFGQSIEGIAQVLNLTDKYRSDYIASFATLGRQTKLGIRWRTR